MKKRVLVTGVLGFAGHYLALCLAQSGYEVIGSSNSSHSEKPDGVSEVLHADLRDFTQVNELVNHVRPTHVVHLAGISVVTHEDVREIYETNVIGSHNLIRALKGLPEPPEAILMMSSANVYGNSTKEVLTEADEFNPANDYAISKVAMEYLSRQFRQSLNIIIARPFNFTGIGQTTNFIVPKIVNHFKTRAEFIELGNIEVYRDFSDVRNVATALVGLLKAPGAINKAFNICSGRPSSLRQVIDLCQKITGHSLEIRVNPKFLRENEVKTLVGSRSQLDEVMGEAKIYSLEETLDWMISG